jgi:very-short-patch-repair endonuclease
LSNRQKLKLAGWKVLRLWEHDVEGRLEKCVLKVVKALK